jgi:plastocyanin
MNTRIAVAVGLGALLAAVLLPISAARPSYAAQVSVSIVSGASSKATDAFAPYPVNANVGDTVVWTNDDIQPHTVVSGVNATPDGKFDSTSSAPYLKAKEQFSHTFSEAGEYPYFCNLHPNMMGKVVVTGATGPKPFEVTAMDGGYSYKVTGMSATSTATQATIEPSKSVHITFDKAGEVELTLPTTMIEGINSVMAGGQTVQYTKTDGTDSTTLKFTVPQDNSTVDIMGTKVIPEFPVIVALILVGSMVAIVGYTRFARTSGIEFLRRN